MNTHHQGCNAGHIQEQQRRQCGWSRVSKEETVEISQEGREVTKQGFISHCKGFDLYLWGTEEP
jgi:hypothetical protein